MGAFLYSLHRRRVSGDDTVGLCGRQKRTLTVSPSNASD